MAWLPMASTSVIFADVGMPVARDFPPILIDIAQQKVRASVGLKLSQIGDPKLFAFG